MEKHRYINPRIFPVQVHDEKGVHVTVAPFDWEPKPDHIRVVEGEHYAKFLQPYGSLAKEPAHIVQAFQEVKKENNPQAGSVVPTSAPANELPVITAQEEAEVEKTVRMDYAFMKLSSEQVNEAVNYILARRRKQPIQCPDNWLAYQDGLDDISGIVDEAEEKSKKDNLDEFINETNDEKSDEQSDDSESDGGESDDDEDDESDEEAAPQPKAARPHHAKGKRPGTIKLPKRNR